MQLIFFNTEMDGDGALVNESWKVLQVCEYVRVSGHEIKFNGNKGMFTNVTAQRFYFHCLQDTITIPWFNKIIVCLISIYLKRPPRQYFLLKQGKCLCEFL